MDLFEPEPEEALAVRVDAEKMRFELASKVLKQAYENIGAVLELLGGGDAERARRTLASAPLYESGGKVVEGIFNGKDMVGSDGKLYSVPANYASKSRLGEGDTLKLTMSERGDFLFKQIAPVERRRRVGTLAFDVEKNIHVVMCGEDVYHCLLASVTYFKGAPGDEVVVLVPSSGKCKWAAVENVVKK